MKRKCVSIVLALSLMLGVGCFNKTEAKAEAVEMPERLSANVTDMNLGGFVGKNIYDNIDKWQLSALKDNPNIIDEIMVAAQMKVNFGSLMSDPFGVNKYYNITLDELNNGYLGKSIKYTYYKKVASFADCDFAFSRDITVNTDTRGAEELWCYVNATDFGTEKVPFRLNFEEGDPTSNIRESWQPKANVDAYIIPDGAAARTAVKTLSEGFIELPVAYKGWVCFPLNENTFTKYWSAGESNGIIDKSDIHQFMANVKGNDTALNKSLYLDAFSIVGSGLTVRDGVIGVPLNINELSGKEFRQLWTVDFPEALTSYTGAIVPWYGEFVGKLLTGMVFSYKLSANEQLLAAIKTVVNELEAVQGADGYLGTYTNTRYSIGGNNWDLWNQYHIVYGLISWYKTSGDERALEVAIKALDCVINFMAEKNNGSYVTWGDHEMNMAIGHTFGMMYTETKQQKYLDACIQIFERDWDKIGNWYKDSVNGKDFFQSRLFRWEALHPISMLSVMYEATDDVKYFNAFTDIWYSIAKTDRHNTGGFSSGEGARGTPYLSGQGAEIETCCTISWMAMSVEYYQMSKNPYAVDELELSFFNGMLGSVMEDHKYVTYNTPMVGSPTAGYDGRKESSQKDITFQWNSGSPDFNCCQANAARGIAQLSEWGVAQDSNNLYLNYFGLSKAETFTPSGKGISIKQTTEYPKNGEIVIEIEDLAAAETFGLALRIPSWSKQSFVTVNGEKKAVENGAYHVINRKWKNGDKIQLDLEMSVHFWAGEQTFDGYTSAYYGPILMALDQKTTPNNNMYNTYFNAGDFKNAVVADASADNNWLYFTVKDRDGNDVKLVDFASCGKYIGEDPGNYSTWLKIDGDELNIMTAGKAYPPVWNNFLSYGVSSKGEGITLIGDKAKGGSEVSFSVSAPSGKEVDAVKVTTASGEVIVTADDGGYSFIMPNTAVTVEATYKEAKSDKKGCGGCGAKVGTNAVVLGLITLGLIPVVIGLRKKTKKDKKA